MRSLEKSLADLERKFHRDLIVLEMPDGSIEEIIIGSGDGLLDLLSDPRAKRRPRKYFPAKWTPSDDQLAEPKRAGT